MLEGRQITDVEGFYNQVGGRAGVTEHYMYSATNIRLRELSIGYSLPQAWLAKTGDMVAERNIEITFLD